MNTTAQALVFAVATVAAAAAIGMGLADRTAPPAGEIVKLERVVIVGKRAEGQAPPVVIAKLPRVLIEGRRAIPTDLHLAAAKQAALDARYISPV